MNYKKAIQHLEWWNSLSEEQKESCIWDSYYARYEKFGILGGIELPPYNAFDDAPKNVLKKEP